MQIILVLGAVLVVLVLLVWLGLHIRPAPFAPFPQTPGVIETVPLPDGLPVPVERFYRQVYGDHVPVLTSVVLSGRATLRPVMALPAFPSRFRFTHIAGQDYRHYLEINWLGQPLIKGNEYFLGGKGHMNLGPLGVSEGPHVDQAANLGLWAESIWLPAIYLTDRRVHWQTVDDTTAIIGVPFGEEEEHLVLRFDPQTGMLRFLEAMRYRDSIEEGKVLWICEALEWTTIAGYILPAAGRVTWFDQGTAWADFNIEKVVYNADVRDYIRQSGP